MDHYIFVDNIENLRKFRLSFEYFWKYYGKWSICSNRANAPFFIIFSIHDVSKVLLRAIGLHESHWNMANCQMKAAADWSFENYSAFATSYQSLHYFIMSYWVIARQKSEKTYNTLRGSWKCRIVVGLLPDACHLAGPTVAPFVAYSLLVVGPILYWDFVFGVCFAMFIVPYMHRSRGGRGSGPPGS